ncbi:GNAT family N-acetyltransferase [Roseomonas sp. KE2513]|uniref:GNAT family N-acetyltransferase n=1 Tax=Roseomonas sp. KE2513 TaxID=2479202 RepID=UPI0018E0268C|nr:GNAT family N-acetyltransferase [Roseomonas sp. KE2513]MBI0534422.1 GNAT family N-acetyltransferase [Roseomonas sp. KE2513]
MTGQEEDRQAQAEAPPWREAVPFDLRAIDLVARAVHPLLPERPEVFAEKLRLFPSGCLVAERGEEVVGYALSHPWPCGAVPPLDHFLGALPQQAACLFIHDVALMPGARGLGAGRSLLARLDPVARRHGLGAMALVSVYGTEPFWQGLGFTTEPDGLAEGYGPSARYMTRPLPLAA